MMKEFRRTSTTGLVRFVLGLTITLGKNSEDLYVLQVSLYTALVACQAFSHEGHLRYQ